MDKVKHDVFISSVFEENEWTKQFVIALKSKGVSVFDPSEIKPGQLVWDRLEEGLRESVCVVLVISPETARSPNVALELGAALGMGKTLIPIIMNGVAHEDLPGPVRLRKSLRQDEPERVADEIARTVAALPHNLGTVAN